MLVDAVHQKKLTGIYEKNLPERKSPNFAELMFKIQDSKKFFAIKFLLTTLLTCTYVNVLKTMVRVVLLTFLTTWFIALWIFQEKWSLFSIFQFFYIQGWNISKLFQYSVGLRMLKALRMYQIGQEYKIGLDMNVLHVTLLKR